MIDLKVKELAQEMIEAIMSSDKISLVDSGDPNPTEIKEDEYSFGMDKIFWGPDGLASGAIEYTVTITAKYQAFDE